MKYRSNFKISIIIIVILIYFVAGCGMKDNNAKAIEEPNKEQISENSEGKQNLNNSEAGKDKAGEANSGKEDGNKENNSNNDILNQMAEMSLEEKIGQLFIVGLEGYSLDDNSLEMIEKHHVGGFILFKRNIKDVEQLVALTNALKAANSNNKIPLFISVDEEGGIVSRMPEGVKKLPSSGSLGRLGSEELSYEVGKILGYELKLFGFNMNFAPVLDINSNPQNPVIGERAFGSDKELVSKLGIQTMKGIQSQGIISVVKHFPGHGDTSVDSHVGLPRVDHGLERLREFELVPFAKAIESGADAVMVAHILFPQIDPENPSTLSKAIITDILKEEMGFEGVVITDDMTMGAIMENYSIGEAVVKSILAGSDLILVCHGHENGLQAITAIREAVEEGAISEDRIDESVYKILKLKKKYNLSDQPVEKPDIQKLNKMIEETLGMAS